MAKDARSRTIVLRADGDSTIGFGHVVRCFALADELTSRGARVVLLSRALDPRLKAMAVFHSVEAIKVEDDDQALEHSASASWVVVDGYGLGSFVEAASALKTPVLVIDDQNELPVGQANLVVNQNFFATPDLYAGQGVRHLLAGPKFSLIRKEVRSIPVRRPERCECVLVSFGGADPKRLSLPVVECLLGQTNWHVRVAVPTTHPDRQAIQIIGERQSRLSIDSGDLVESLALADLAVVGAGTTVFEAAYLKIPTIGVATVPNQVLGAVAASDAGVMHLADANPNNIVTAAQEMAQTDFPRRPSTRVVVDGFGASRVSDEIQRNWLMVT